MKLLLAAFTILSFSGPLMAETVSVRASDVKCADLQKALLAQGTLHIIIGPFDWGNDYVADGQFCPSNKEPRAAYVSSSDATFCRVGWACMRRP